MAELQKKLEDIYHDANIKDYYSGGNVDVFFDNIYVDECTMIGYRSVVNSAPVYAYNNSKFNSITEGTFRVEGKFSVNFRSTGYLEHILLKGEEQRKNGSYMPLGRVSANNAYKGVGATSTSGFLNSSSPNFLNSAVFNPRATQLSDSELQIAKAKLRDYLWGYINPSDEDYIDSIRDIMKGKYFDILLMFGNPNTDDYDVKNVVDAMILDVSIEVVKDMPVQLVYTFIARDVDRPSSRPNPYFAIQEQIDIAKSVQITPAKMIDYIDELMGKVAIETISNLMTPCKKKQ